MAETKDDDPEASAEDRAPPVSPEEKRRIAHERTVQRLQANRERFEADSVDIDWAGPTEDAIEESVQNLIADEFPDTQIVSHECKSEVCRPVVEHGSRDELGRFAFDFKLNGHDIDYIYRSRRVSTDGRLETVVYLTRNGSKFL